MLFLFSFALGLYDFASTYFGTVAVAARELVTLLLVRYAGLLPALLLIRLWLYTGMEFTNQRIALATAMLVVMPAIALMGSIVFVGDQVRPCADYGAGVVIPDCPLERTAPSLPPAPPAPSAPVGSLSVPPRVCALAGEAEGLCEVGYHADYLRTIGMFTFFICYTIAYANLSTIATSAFFTSGFGMGVILLTQRYITYAKDTAQESRYPDSSWGPPEYAALCLWWLLSHAVGILHYRLRSNDLHQLVFLKKRHKRLLLSIREETEHCEQLLKNILPPHVLHLLGGLITASDHHKRGGGGPAKTIAERYQHCSFLFAKICGLSKLVNDASVDPRDMMHCLQVMFDRFDQLADMFGVQKVRKTANEYYLVAAGLPNPQILPSPEDRARGIAGFGFAMMNIMNIINLELAQYGITFACQVGIHSGSAIAGVIGTKTFQYDLCGDAVNTAARMCSYSKPGHMNISDATYELLKDDFGAVPREPMHVKGKGQMKTYYLLNMPVEQQEALKLLAEKEGAAIASKVQDTWARKSAAGSATDRPGAKAPAPTLLETITGALTDRSLPTHKEPSNLSA